MKMMYYMWNTYDKGRIWTIIDWAAQSQGEHHNVGRWIPATLIHQKMTSTLSMLPNSERWELSIDNGMGEVEEEGGKMYGARYSSTSLEEHQDVISKIRDIYDNDSKAFSEVYVMDMRDAMIDIGEDCSCAVIGTEDIISGRRCHRSLPESTEGQGYTCGEVYYSIMNVVGNENLNEESSTLYLYVVNYTRSDGRKSSYNYLCGEDDIYAISDQDGRTFEEKVRWIQDHHLYHLKRVKVLQRPAWEIMARTYEYDLLLNKNERKEMQGELEIKYALGERITYGLNSRPTWKWTNSTFLEKMGLTQDEHKEMLKNKRSISNEEHKNLFDYYRQDPFLGERRGEELKAWATNKFNVYVYDIHEREVSDPSTVGCKKHKDAFRYWVNECP